MALHRPKSGVVPSCFVTLSKKHTIDTRCQERCQLSGGDVCTSHLALYAIVTFPFYTLCSLSMVVKVDVHKMLSCRRGGIPVHDWADLLQPRLEGRLGFLDSPRDFIGVALKTLGLPFNCSHAQLTKSTVSLQQLKSRVKHLRQQVSFCADCSETRHPEICPGKSLHNLQFCCQFLSS